MNMDLYNSHGFYRRAFDTIIRDISRLRCVLHNHQIGLPLWGSEDETNFMHYGFEELCSHHKDLQMLLLKYLEKSPKTTIQTNGDTLKAIWHPEKEWG